MNDKPAEVPKIEEKVAPNKEGRIPVLIVDSRSPFPEGFAPAPISSRRAAQFQARDMATTIAVLPLAAAEPFRHDG
jgi:hypothetical protein